MWPIDWATLLVQLDGAVTGLGTNPRSMPDSTKYVPSVAITGGIRSLVTITPLTAPTPAPMASSIGTAASGLPSGVPKRWVTKRMLVNPIRGATDRSMPPPPAEDGGRARHAGEGERCQVAERRRDLSRRCERRLHDGVGHHEQDEERQGERNRPPGQAR